MQRHLATFFDSCQYSDMTLTVTSTPATKEAPACESGCAPGEGLSGEQAEQVSALLKALADPVRLRLYSRIAGTPDQTCVCDLGDVGVSQPTVSHHLRKLREAGLIESERRGTWVYYRTVPRALEPVAALLGR